MEGEYPMRGQPMGENPDEQAVSPSTVPELEQILVKIQELDSRIGDLEIGSGPNMMAEEDMGADLDTLESGKNPYEKRPTKTMEQIEGEEEEEEEEPEGKKKMVMEGKKYEMLRRKYERLMRLYKESRRMSKRLREQEQEAGLTGTPEIEKGRKKVDLTQAADAEVPRAQTSDINYDAGGVKTGAPVAGEETDDKFSKKAEDEAISEVPKPKSEHPHEPIIKNSLRKKEQGATVGVVTDDTERDPTTTADAGKPAPTEPEKMEDEEGQGMKTNAYKKEYEKLADKIKREDMDRDASQKAFSKKMSESLTKRQSVVGVSEGLRYSSGAKERTNQVIKEYLRVSGSRF